MGSKQDKSMLFFATESKDARFFKRLKNNWTKGQF